MSATPKLSGQVKALILARAVNQLGGFSLAFLTVLLAHDFGASLMAAGIVSAAFGLATIPSRLAGGRLADRWGRRRTIVAGLAGLAVAQLGLAASPGMAAATVCAVVMGLAFEIFEPPSQATIADAVPPARRASAFELLTTAMAVGGLAAGVIADVVGRWSLRWLFVVDAGTGLACAAIVFLALAPDHVRAADQYPDKHTESTAESASERTGRRSDRSGGRQSSQAEIPAGGSSAASLGSVVPTGERADAGRAQSDAESNRPAGRRSASAAHSPWRDRALLLVTASGTVFALVSMLRVSVLPLSLAVVGLNPADAGLIMAVATATLVVSRPVLSSRGAALSPVATFILGYVLMAAGFCGYAVAHSLPMLMVPTALYSLGNLLVMGRSFALVSELAPAEASARYLAVYGLSWGVATLLAPLVGTWLIGLSGAGLLWGVCAAICGAMAVGQPWVVRRISRVPDDLGVIHSTKPVADRYDAMSI